ncbi:MAG: UPF0104 family protein [Alphaproteobacteria bacterium]|nr:UPF0104 family protein [Alphaproteobacteria bacterium]
MWQTGGPESRLILAVNFFQRWRYWLFAALALVIGILFYEAIHDLVAQFNYDTVLETTRTTDQIQLSLALLATAISFVALTGYDYSSLRYVKAEVPYWITAQTAFTAYAISNTAGLGVLTGGQVRMRLYRAAGVDISKISLAIASNAAGFGFGILTTGAIALLWRPEAVSPLIHTPEWVLQGVALLICRGP